MFEPNFVPIHLADIDIFNWINDNFDLLVALRLLNLVGFILWGRLMSVQTFLAVHQIVS